MCCNCWWWWWWWWRCCFAKRKVQMRWGEQYEGRDVARFRCRICARNSLGAELPVWENRVAFEAEGWRGLRRGGEGWEGTEGRVGE